MPRTMKNFHLITLLFLVMSCLPKAGSQGSTYLLNGESSSPKKGILFGPEFEFDLEAGASGRQSQSGKEGIGKFHEQLLQLLQKAELESSEVSRNGESKVFHFKKNASPPFTDLKLATLTLGIYASNPTNQDEVEQIRPTRLQLETWEGKGYTVTYATDDVLFEVQISPLTLEEVRRHRPLFEAVIFQSMKGAGLVPPVDGGGHIHIGVDSLVEHFGSRVAALYSLRQFIVDLYNHPHILTRIMRSEKNFAINPWMTDTLGRGYDIVQDGIKRLDAMIAKLPQATSAQSLSEAQIDQLREAMSDVTLTGYLDEIDHGRYYDDLHYFDSLKEVDETYDQFLIKPDDRNLYPALRYSERYNTLEIRSLRAQRNFSEFYVLATLFSLKLEQNLSIAQPLELLSLEQSPLRLGFHSAKIKDEIRRYFEPLKITKKDLSFMVRSLTQEELPICP